MSGLTFFILLLIIASAAAITFAVYYNAFQKYVIKINEVESKIDETLRERFDLLLKASDFIKQHLKKDVMEELNAIESNQLSSFELDRKLVAITREFYNLKFAHKELVKKENFIELDFALKENDAELDGYTLYYNDNIAKLNKLVRVFPSNIIARMSGIKEKTFYDGKNMSDKNTNDFKL